MMPIVFVIYYQNLIFFSLLISVVCLGAFYEWIKNNPHTTNLLFWSFKAIIEQKVKTFSSINALKDQKSRFVE